jgi:hypothetical protein
LFISGDFHIGALGYVDPPGGPAAGVWEVLAGPGGSPINPVLNFGVEFDQARFPVVLAQHNCVLFEADPDTGEVRVDFVGDSGDVIATQTLAL